MFRIRISKIFGLNKSQYELDFVDIEVNKDLPLFLDPYFISKMEFPFAYRAYSSLRSFFNYLIALLRGSKIDEAQEIFSYLGEANEICLGFSKGIPSGKGMGPKDAEKIFKSLLDSKAYKTGLMEDIEDFRIFVPNVDKDKVSDMTTNIIKKHLIQYTQEQCKLWDIKLTDGVTSGYYWEETKKGWDNKHTKMLVYEDRKIILVPKRIVSFSKEYTSQKYTQHFVLNFLQNEHLKLQSQLVRERIDKTAYVTKKDIRDNTRKMDKGWLARFTLEHPEVFKKFKKETINKIEPFDNRENIKESLEDVCKYLKNQLISIKPGPEEASIYHKTIVGILELLFYPHLCNPKVEEEIHDGRKRIDITFDNCAESGFFKRLSSNHKIPSSFIIIECKNYTNDISNPEIDQLSSRFSTNRGKFGISACRQIEEYDLLIKRCQDTFKDDRGLIIPFVDDDFIHMLEQFPEKEEKAWETILQKRFHEIGIS